MQIAWMGLNWLAILVAAVLCMVLGGVWYSPLLFARRWTILSGYDPDDAAKMAEMRKGAPRLYALAFLAAGLQGALLAKIMWATGIKDPLYGMKLGLGIWLGAVMPVQLTGALFSRQKTQLFLINTGYQLVCYLAMGALLAPWYAR